MTFPNEKIWLPELSEGTALIRKSRQKNELRSLYAAQLSEIGEYMRFDVTTECEARLNVRFVPITRTQEYKNRE